MDRRDYEKVRTHYLFILGGVLGFVELQSTRQLTRTTNVCSLLVENYSYHERYLAEKDRAAT